MEYRYEIKYLRCADLGSITLLESIKRHPAVFTEIYSPRRVNNIYFDTLNFDAVEENVSGYANRRKVRVRWYGDRFGQNYFTLEFKNKAGLVGSKDRYSLGTMELASGNSLSKVFSECFSKLPLATAEIMAGVKPSLMNSYSRSYFQSRCGRFRATIDTDITYFAVAQGLLSSKPSAVLEKTQVMEIKFSVADHRVIDSLVRHFPFRVTKSSKYVNGIDLLSRQGLC